jgi:hypothetical protein
LIPEHCSVNGLMKGFWIDLDELIPTGRRLRRAVVEAIGRWDRNAARKINRIHHNRANVIRLIF